MQGQHVDAREPAGDRADLAGAGQEHEHVAVALAQGPPYRRRHVVEQAGVDPQAVRRIDRRGRWRPHHVDREQRVVGGHDRCAARCQHRGEPARVGRRGRGEQPQVGPEVGADVDAEREREVGVEVPLVALVEDDGVHAGQLRVALEPPDEQPGRDHLDPRVRAGAAVAAHGVPDPAADR